MEWYSVVPERMDRWGGRAAVFRKCAHLSPAEVSVSIGTSLTGVLWVGAEPDL